MVPPPSITTLVNAVAARLFSEPDLDHFLLWRGSTIEHWLQMVISAVGNQTARWAARNEVLYMTGTPADRRKYGDGAVVWGDGVGALIEVKAAYLMKRSGDIARAIVDDVVCLAAIDWPATCSETRLSGSEADWPERRSEITQAWGLQVALLHGPAPLEPPNLVFDIAARARSQSVGGEFVGRVSSCLAVPIAVCSHRTTASQAHVYAWALPLEGSAAI